MHALITGGTGFVGTYLARTLLARGRLQGAPIERITLADQHAPHPTLLADVLADARVRTWTGALLDRCDAVAHERFDAVFHLASAVSAECEADFDLGMRSNLDSTRALLDALRRRVQAGHAPARLVFSSSVAVFGPGDDVGPLDAVDDGTLPAPQTSYGMQKLASEYLVADYSRKGFVDGRSARLMTVTVRPGKPNGAASSFFSSIVREPLAGREAVCPVSPEVTHPAASPRATVHGLIAVAEASRAAYGQRSAVNLPALNVSVQGMLDALERVAGPAVRARVRFERDEAVAGIVARWPRGARASWAARQGLMAESRFDDIVQQYIDDCRRLPDADQTSLKGLA